MGLLNLLFGKKESSKQNISSEPIEKNLPLKDNNIVKESSSKVEEPLQYTTRQVSQIIDYLAKEDTNYNAICYENNLGEVDMGRLDPLFEDAARLIVIHQQGSTSLIQRKFAIGYNRSGRIMDQLEKLGIVGPTLGSSPREVFCLTEEDLQSRLSNWEYNSFDPQKAISNMTKEEIDKFKNEYKEKIKDREHYYNVLIEEHKHNVIRQEIENEKARIKEEFAKKKRSRDIREAAMKELVEEGIIDSNYTKKREPIPQDVQDAVWNRDGGRCVKCGSQDNLEFDHIIPFSKGGSTTIRNLQLLCKKCNLSKSNKIG